jgi:integrase
MIPTHRQEAFLTPPASLTEFEKADGRPMTFAQSGMEPAAAGIFQKAALFRSQVLPATQALLTREGHFGAWRTFVSYLLIEGVLLMAIPVTEVAVQGFFMHCILTGYSAARLTSMVEAIIDRHYLYRITPQIPPEKIRWWATAATKTLGLPETEKFPVLASHIKAFLRLPRTSLRILRDITMLCVGTICALRSKELRRLDVCDVVDEIDGKGTMGLLLWKRKNDGNKRGLFPRIGQAKDADMCVIRLIKAYMKRAGLSKHKNCTKDKWRRSPCDACGRLFRNTTAAGARIAETKSKHDISGNTLAKALKDMLALIGVEPGKYSPVSLRKGGVSTALAGGLPEDLRNLQSGHRSSCWKAYADITQRAQLYRFFGSFGL